MKDIIFSELLRFRKLALVIGLCNLLLLMVLDAKENLLVFSSSSFTIFVTVPALICFIFGLYQFGRYRKLAQWTYLIHRPLSMGRIFTSLLCGALLLMLAVFILPIALLYITIDLFGERMIEYRHYYLLLYCLGYSVSFYLAASFSVLHPKKIAYVVLLLPVILFSGTEVGYEIFVKQLLLIAYLLWITSAAFKTEIDSNFDKPLNIISGILPVQFGLYAMMVAGFFPVGIIGHDIQTKQMPHSVNVTTDKLRFEMPKLDSMLWGLTGLTENNVESYRKQLQGATFSRLDYWMWDDMEKIQTRYQPHFNDQNYGFYDAKNAMFWQFSHEQQLFKGTSFDQETPQWLGLNGVVEDLSLVSAASRFPFIPYVVNNVIYGQGKVYQFNSTSQQLDLRFELPTAESLHTVLLKGSNYLALSSDKSLYLFYPADINEKTSEVQPFSKIDLPRNWQQLMGVNVAELADGYMLSLIYGDDSMDSIGYMHTEMKPDLLDAEIYTIKTDFGGDSTLLNHKLITAGIPAWLSYGSYLISPAFAYAEFGLKSLESEYKINDHIPKEIIYLMLIIWLLNAAVCAFLLLPSQKTIAEKSLWIVGSAGIGLPGLLCCWLLSDWRSEIPKISA
jgi:hypothetical protein